MWVLNVNSESGDKYKTLYFKQKLNDKDLEIYLKNSFPDEWEDCPGPGIFGSFLYIKWSEL